MPVYFDKTEARWRFTFNRIVSGRRIRATKLLPSGWNRSQAQEFERQETNRLYAMATGAGGHRARIDDAIEIYCRERIPELKHGKKQMAELARFVAAYEGRYMDDLAEVCREYQEAERGKLAPATIRNRLAYLRSACRYAFKVHKLCEHDPAERMRLPTVRNERHFYSDRAQVLQIARRIQNFSARAAVLGGFYSGMRLGELRRAKVKGDTFLLEDSKNGERRMVPIHYKLRSYLHRFPIQAAERTIQGQFKKAVKALALDHLRLHDLRHSAASAMINNKVDLYTVGAVLGHKTPISTKRYSHLATETLAAAVAKIGAKSDAVEGRRTAGSPATSRTTNRD